MLQKNFQSQKNKDQSSNEFGFALVFASEEISDNNSNNCDDHSSNSDNGDRFKDWRIEESKCDSDSKCINAGGYCENKHVVVIYF